MIIIEKKVDMLACTPVQYNYLGTLVRTFSIPATQNQFVRENIFNKAPVGPITIAVNKSSAVTGSLIENPFCLQQFDLR